jgi:2-hydroxychromene-2-carboxylate isomerase
VKPVTFYLDFVSPYAWLAFEQLPKALQGLSYSICYRPVLLGGLIKHHQNKAPADTPAKRRWTYRHAEWLGHELGTPLKMPAEHPFNPLPLLRLAVACGLNSKGHGGDPNRYVCETIFRHVWDGGSADGVRPDANDPERLKDLHLRLTGTAAPDEYPLLGSDALAVKDRLRANTDEAIRHGAFGVPTFVAHGQGDRIFWGLDSLLMLRRCLEGDPWFDLNDLPEAAQRMPRMMGQAVAAQQAAQQQ